MKVIVKRFLVCIFLIFVMPFVAFAEDDRMKELERKINELSQELQKIKAQEVDKKVNVITQEIEKLKLGAVAEPKYESFAGLGPAA